MIDSIFDTIYRNTYIIFAFFFGLVLSFCLQIDKVKVSLLPNIDPLGFTILTQIENLGAEEVDSLITFPLIQALEKTKDLKEIRGRSTFGRSEIELYIKGSNSPDEVYENIQQIIFGTKDVLPSQTNRSLVSRIQKSILPFYEIAIPMPEDDNFDSLSREINEFKDNIQKLDGISLIQVFGLERDPILISADSLKMDSFPVHTKIVEDSLHRYQKKESLGILETKTESYLLQAETRYQDVWDLPKISTDVSTIRKPIELGRVISIHKPLESKRKWTRWNQKSTVLIRIFRLPESNPLLLASMVKKNILKFERLEYASILSDESEYLKNQIFWTLLFSVLAFLGSFLISYYYYRSIKYSIYLILGLLFGILIAFHFLILFSIPFHVLTFCAFGIGIGVMYDSMNVVIYSIHKENGSSFSKLENIKKGITSVLLSIFSAMATTVIVFLPIILVEDKILFLFKDFAKIISILIASGFVSALLIVPALFLRFGSVVLANLEKDSRCEIFENLCLRSGRYIGKYFRSNAILLVVPLLILVLLSVSYEIFPKLEKQGVWVEIDSSFTTSKNELYPLVLNLEEEVRQRIPEAEILVVPREHSLPWSNTILVYIRNPLDLSILPKITNELKLKGFKVRFGCINNTLEDILPLERAEGVSLYSLDIQKLYNELTIIKQRLNSDNLDFFVNKDLTKTKVKIYNSGFLSRSDLGFREEEFLEVSRLNHFPKWIGKTKDGSQSDIYLAINYGKDNSDPFRMRMKSDTGKSIAAYGLWEFKEDSVFDEIHRNGRYFSVELRPLISSHRFQNFFENKKTTNLSDEFKIKIESQQSEFTDFYIML
ncbi:MAG: efflux RND transporter permease subunit, partial [Leptospira sp.]|nr:efflux RND transporter permease subunit [Leptospira sp.]